MVRVECSAFFSCPPHQLVVLQLFGWGHKFYSNHRRRRLPFNRSQNFAKNVIWNWISKFQKTFGASGIQECVSFQWKNGPRWHLADSTEDCSLKTVAEKAVVVKKWLERQPRYLEVPRSNPPGAFFIFSSSSINGIVSLIRSLKRGASLLVFLFPLVVLPEAKQA